MVDQSRQIYSAGPDKSLGTAALSALKHYIQQLKFRNIHLVSQIQVTWVVNAMSTDTFVTGISGKSIVSKQPEIS
jgi:hypothetical protein